MEIQANPFEQFKLNRQLLDAIADAGYTEPTPIQQQAIPLAMSGHDVLGIAQTGTGKTAAFVLPLLMKVKYAQGHDPRALIMAPTRELVMQIAKAAEELGSHTDLRIVALYGGVGPRAQIEALRQGVDILVTTPQRFLDLYAKGEIVLKHIKTMVLDEADKMLDMGFMPQIRRILEVIPTKRQNLLFSATFQEKVEKFSYEFLEFPMRVEVTPQATTAEMVTQSLYEVPNFLTKNNLLELLFTQDEDFNRVLIFTRSKATADNVYKFLIRKVLKEGNVRVIHANKGQNTRINAMEAFKDGEIRVLVATDVASRGIDVTEVSHVINFDVPIIYEDYVHRIGRTGRANHTGAAITFLTPPDEYHIKKIEELIRTEIPRQPLPANLTVLETPKEEKQSQLREIDDQRRREDPTFQGAFHEKKKPVIKPSPKSRSSARKSRKKGGPRPPRRR